MIINQPSLRRLAWRLGRRVYCEARGEPSRNFPESNGELALARAVVAAADKVPVLTLLDVGANLGDWASPVLESLPESRRMEGRLRLHVFEPVPIIRDQLQERLRHHPYGRLARVETCAISDEPGITRMAVFGETEGTHTLVFDKAAQKLASDVIEVERMTLAGFVERNRIEHVHLVKIDTEGHDSRVLRGALPLLTAGRIDVAQFEYNHRWIEARAYLKDVFDLVEGLPYRVARVMPDGLELFEAWHPELERFFEANYALVRLPLLDGLDVRLGTFDGSNTYA